MGRLIDAGELLKQPINTAHYPSNFVKHAPTVEAISKAEYEARLKADMVAMLEEIQNEIQKYSGCSCTCSDGVVNDIDDLIQEKINKLKGEQNV